MMQVVLTLLLLVGFAASAALPPVPDHIPAQSRTARMKAVLVAGDGRINAFDNAVGRMSNVLQQAGTAPADIVRFSSNPAVMNATGGRRSARDSVLRAIEAMQPASGEGCFVFITSHGHPYRGLLLVQDDSAIDPDAIDRALAAGCGNAPTVLIASGCFSGSFAQPPVNRANRVVLTASRADRVSFGCGDTNVLTDFDDCLLAHLPAPRWADVVRDVRACVGERERRMQSRPSLPQASIGGAVTDLPALIAP